MTLKVQNSEMFEPSFCPVGLVKDQSLKRGREGIRLDLNLEQKYFLSFCINLAANNVFLNNCELIKTDFFTNSSMQVSCNIRDKQYLNTSWNAGYLFIVRKQT